jgi:Sulfotransferase family
MQNAASELAPRALTAGYDPHRAIERLANGSFVSPARRYMYVETPKVACTSIKHLILAIEGLALNEDAMPYQRETRTDMLVHHRRHIAMPTLLSADQATRTAILGGADGWMIFAVVRNPFSRLVSFFDHKIRLGEPGYAKLEQRYGNVARFGGLKQTFTAFVEDVVADAAALRRDVHIMPQCDVIMPRLIPYSQIFQLEVVEEMTRALAAHLSAPLTLMPGRSVRRDWRTYYEPHSVEIVAKAYQRDFARFGYDLADWQPRADVPSNATNEEYWRSELVARNAMIDHLYDRLSLPSAIPYVETRARKSGAS